MPDLRPRLFIAGEHGQVAQALSRACAAHGYAHHMAGRTTADISDRQALITAVKAFRPSAVVNAAAYTAVDMAEDESEHAFAINRDGAANVAAAAAEANAFLVHISTDYVYDGCKPSPYVETDPPAPLGVYGVSKLAGETAIATVGVEAVILRTSWVCSPDGNNFIKTMLRLAGQRQEIGVVDDQWGAPTFASDLAAVILSIVERLLSAKGKSFAGIYHATSAGETTWCRFANAIMQGSASRGGPSCRVRPITTSEYPTRARRPANSRLDCSKLALAFGIRLPQWQASLDACLDQLLTTSERIST